MKIFILILLILSFSGYLEAQTKKLSNKEIGRLLQIPRQYTILKTNEKITLDGKADEKSWSKAPWTGLFTDIISGKKSDVMGNAQCKLLWDDHFLYLYAQLEEPDIRAFIKVHDKPVYQGNAFELFVNPDGSTHNYFEFQINALGTTCDLFLSKPYRNGGTPLLSWDMKGLKKAIHLNGTLNDPSDTDTSWNIELAIPFSSVVMNRKQYPRPGTIWRMNFSRVEWDVDILNGKYVRKRNKENKSLPVHYSVWSPQGIINLHYPERWGYVMFSDKLNASEFLSEKAEKLKLLLWRYYYLQQNFRGEYGHYASSIQKLNKTFPKETDTKDSKLKMEATRHQFWIQCYFPSIDEYLSVDQDGEMQWEKDQ